MSVFRLGLSARLGRYWPVGLVTGVAVGFVALTMLLSSVGRNSLLGAIDSRPVDLVVQPADNWIPGEPWSAAFEASALVAKLGSRSEVAWVGVAPAGPALAQLESNQLRLISGPEPTEYQLWQLEEGQSPAGADEIAVSRAWALAFGVSLGDSLPVIGPGLDEPRTLVVSGLIEIDGGLGLGFDQGGLLTNLAVVTPAAAQAILGLGPDQSFQALVKLAPGVDRLAAFEALEADLPSGYRLLDLPSPGLEEIDFLTAFVGVFVFLALLVAVFVIVNVFRIVLASQVRDLATLRLLGATRSQVLGRLLGEAGLMAALAGSLSVVLAWGLAALAVPAVNRWWDWELVGPSVSAWTWLVPVLAGLVATLIGGLLPAIVASRRRPVTALGQTVETPTPRRSLVRVVVGGSLVGLCLLGLLLPATWQWDLGFWRSLLYGLASLGLLLGLALVSVGLAGPFGRLAGWLGQPLGRVVWRLATSNIGRQPGRSAAVANSLLIGVSLITVVTILASSFQASSHRLLDHYFPSDWWISREFGDNQVADWLNSASYEQAQIDSQLADQLVNSGLLDQPTVVRLGQGVARLTFVEPDGTTTITDLNVGGFDPDTLEGNFNYDLQPTDRATALTAGQVLVNRRLGNFNYDLQPTDQTIALAADPVPVNRRSGDQLMVGDQLAVFYPNTNYRADYIVGGTFVDNDLDLILATEHYLAAVQNSGVTFIAGDSPAGLTDDEVRDGLNQLLVSQPGLAVYDLRTDIKLVVDQTIATGLNIFRGLLGLSLLVAVLGIFSTLVLSVRERRREIGVLRAIGLTRGQVVGLIGLEGVVMALFGVGLGLLAGWMVGFAIIEIIRADQALAEFLQFSQPWLTLVVYGLLAAIVGGLAALGPALVMARRSIVDCLTRD